MLRPGDGRLCFPSTSAADRFLYQSCLKPPLRPAHEGCRDDHQLPFARRLYGCEPRNRGRGRVGIRGSSNALQLRLFAASRRLVGALLSEGEREAGDAWGEAQAEPVAFGLRERNERVEALAAHGDDAVVDV